MASLNTQELVPVPIESEVQPVEGQEEDGTIILSPQAQFLTRIRLYPIVISFRSSVFAIPGTRALADAVKPTLKVVRNSQPLKTLMDNGDFTALYVLDLVDRIFPSLQLLTPQDITDPIILPVTNTVKAVTDTANNAANSIQKNFIDPSTTRFLNLITDSNGKAIISSRFDPVFLPINNNLEQLTKTLFGDNIKKAPKEKLASEFLRTSRILYNALFQIKEPEVPSALEEFPIPSVADLPEPAPSAVE